MFRKSNRWLYRAIVATILFSALLGAIAVRPVYAATPLNQIELVGTITAVGTNTLTINALTINTSRAEINTALTVGAMVKVQGALATDGTIIAREVSAPEAKDLPDATELVGTLDSFQGNLMVIGGQTVDVSQAELKPGIIVGGTVKAEVPPWVMARACQRGQTLCGDDSRG